MKILLSQSWGALVQSAKQRLSENAASKQTNLVHDTFEKLQHTVKREQFTEIFPSFQNVYFGQDSLEKKEKINEALKKIWTMREQNPAIRQDMISAYQVAVLIAAYREKQGQTIPGALKGRLTVLSKNLIQEANLQGIQAEDLSREFTEFVWENRQEIRRDQEKLLKGLENPEELYGALLLPGYPYPVSVAQTGIKKNEGWRHSTYTRQDDRIAAFTSGITDSEELKGKLEQLPDIIEKDFETTLTPEQRFFSGATLSVAILTPEGKLLTLNIGDSPIHLASYSAKKGKIKELQFDQPLYVEQVIKNLTEAQVSAISLEMAKTNRELAMGSHYGRPHTVSYFAIPPWPTHTHIEAGFQDIAEPATLQLSNNLASGLFAPFLLKTPYTNSIDLKTEKLLVSGQTLFLCLTSDGLFKTSGKKTVPFSEFLPILQDYYEQNGLDYIAQFFVRHAYEKNESPDNIPACIVPITSAGMKLSKRSLILVILDGNGPDGNIVASKAAERIKREFQGTSKY